MPKKTSKKAHPILKEFENADLSGNLSETRERVRSALEHFNGADSDGASLLDIQRGVFNILQGAAYRVSRIKYAIDYHTHERDTNYPYLFSNFVKFAQVVIDLYKSLGVVDAKFHPTLDAVAASVVDAEGKLRDQIANWSTKKEQLLETMVGKKAPGDHEQKIEKKSRSLLNLMKNSVMAPPQWIRDSVGALNKTSTHAASRRAVAFSEGFDDVDHSGDSKIYLDHEERVLLDTADEKLGGCMITVRYWYEDFMPKLLAACSVGAVDPDFKHFEPKHKELDKWFAQEKKARHFARFGRDVLEGWKECSPEEKLNVKRAWRLARHYILGPQKMRERGGPNGVDHRETGDLSQYIAFIDVYLGKRYVEQSQMRLTFPYFIGPSTWLWHHASAERAASLHAVEQAQSDAIVENIKRYFTLLVTMYPCPYCRHHLNEFVIVNRELELYPVEYIWAGFKPDPFKAKQDIFTTTPEEKINYIKDGLTARLFVWKLHNAVNSSIERSEEWYKSANSVNTSRYWPNIEATLHRATYRSGLVSSLRMSKIVQVLEKAMHLSVLRESIIHIDQHHIAEMRDMVDPLIEELDKTIVESGFLQRCFTFRPDLVDEILDASKMNQDFIRHEHFTVN